MTRADLFNEYADLFFALAPLAREADDPVSREDVEDLRRKLVAISDLVALKMAMDSEFTPEDAVDDAMELDADVGRD